MARARPPCSFQAWSQIVLTRQLPNAIMLAVSVIYLSSSFFRFHSPFLTPLPPYYPITSRMINSKATYHSWHPRLSVVHTPTYYIWLFHIIMRLHFGFVSVRRGLNVNNTPFHALPNGILC